MAQRVTGKKMETVAAERNWLSLLLPIIILHTPKMMEGGGRLETM